MTSIGPLERWAVGEENVPRGAMQPEYLALMERFRALHAALGTLYDAAPEHGSSRAE